MLFYQPKVECRSGRVEGFEALVRWQHPRLGLVLPDRFIPLAEEAGLIDAVTRWVLDAAVRQWQTWRSAGMDLSLSVNLSAFDLQDPALPTFLGRLLSASGFPAQALTLEITETAVLREPARALDVLRQLRALGVRASLDDFGTGYSSLAYLQQLPVNELKIERSFVRELAHEARDQAIVRSTIQLGHSLGLTVVAEGVEDKTTLDLLAGLGCDQAQGYLLGRPMPAAEVRRWLRASDLAA